MLAMQHDWPLDVTELQPALELVLALARADMGILMLHDDGEDALFPVLGYGLDETKYELFGSPRPGVGAFGRAIKDHQFVRIRDVLAETDGLVDAARGLGFCCAEVLPFFGTDGGSLGAFGMLFRGKRGSRRRATKLERFCADVVASAVSHASAQVQAERIRERMARATEAKIQFLAKMSHELRTPLQSIAGYIELLRAGSGQPLTAEQDRMLARITESENILVHIIDDVITISRLEAGHIAYNIGPVSAADAVRATKVVVDPLAIDHGISIEIEPSLPGLLVKADGDKLKQILVNLAANAIKFTRPPGRVTLSYRAEGDTIRFDVADTGPGIVSDKLREIFEPYVQVGSPVLDAYGGSGLGLTISREFAAGMAGELSAASEVGHGSVFTLRL
ncbi:MAG TPA: ATP-binding protein, partial [Gemmatimonadaceae bacterium]|nr:ATP-binding protein [Gemmatimonadaceae bacterium]